MKTYDYVVRVSSLGDRDRDETDTIPDQVADCQQVIADRGSRVGRRIDAIDMSGGIVLESDAYRQALERIQSGKSDGLVAAYSSRFARDHWGFGAFVHELQKHDADLWFADKPDLDYRDQTGQVIMGVGSSTDEAYLKNAKRLAKKTLERKLADGVPSQVPFGYRRLEDKTIEPDPETSETVLTIFTRRAEGDSWVSISEATGLPVSSLRSIVRNEAYLGHMVIKRREHRRGKANGKELRRNDAWTALVPKQLWKAAQSATTVQRNGSHAAGIAGGMLRCVTCGGLLSVAGSEPHLTYGCRRQRNKGKCEAPVFITKRIADDFVEATVLDILRDGKLEAVAASRDIERLRNEVAEAEAELNAFMEVTSALGSDFKEQATSRKAKLDEAKDALGAAVASGEAAGALPNASAWSALPADARRRVARVVIASVTVAQADRSRSPVERLEVSFTHGG